MKESFFAIGHDDLEAKDDLEENETVCPNCHQLHKIKYGKDKDGNISNFLAFVKCPKNNESYLVGMKDKKLF